MVSIESQRAGVSPTVLRTSSQAEMMYQEALWYHGLGFNVVPLERPAKGQTKKPTTKWKGWQTKRQDRKEISALHSRTTEENELHWEYGILAIDGINQIRHLDIDKAKSYQVVEQTLAALGLPPDFPWVVQSGSGQGWHIAFRCEGDISQLLPGHEGSSAKAVYFGEAKDPEQFDHLELRWQAALTTLPPSTHWTGGHYSFANDRPKELPPHIPLERVIAAFHQIATPKVQQAPPDQRENVTSLEKFRAQRTSDEHQGEERWVQKALDEELWHLAKTKKGNRNEQLNKAAFALGQIVAGGLLSETEVTNRLTSVARQIGLAEQEILPTIGSGLSAGKAQPRTPAPLPFPSGRPTPSAGGPSTGSTTSNTSPPPTPLVKPLIVINCRQEHEVVEDALAALLTANAVPHLYVRSGKLVRVKVDEKGCAHIELVTEAMLRLRLLEVAEWAKYDAKGELKHASPTQSIVQDILAAQSWPFPTLEGITEIPLVRPDGSLLTTPGYDAATGMVYVPHPDLRLPAVSNTPTRGEVERALKRIWTVIGEFPYVELADRANALGLLLTPFLRRAIGGHVPVALVDAPKQGTGKGLFTDINALLVTAQTACPMQESKDDDEWRKAITSTLLRGTSLVVIDNLDHTLKSGRLASALTLHTWSDRLLSRNEIVNIPFKVTWIANGNNIKLGGDMGSRTYRIRMDAKQSNPSARDNFTIKDLVKYVGEHRAEIIADLLTIIRSWYASGKPLKLMPKMRSFSEWATTIGSILNHAGIHEFLANLEKMKQDVDERETQWYAFFKAWYDVIGSTWAPTRAVLARMGSSDPDVITRLAESLPDFLAEARAEKPSTFHIRLGRELRGQVDTCYGKENLRLERETDSHTGQPKWRVTCQGTTSGPDPLPLFPPPGEPDQEMNAGDAGDTLLPETKKSEPDESPRNTMSQVPVETPASPAHTLTGNDDAACEAILQELIDLGGKAESEASPAAVDIGCHVQSCQQAVETTGSQVMEAWCQEHRDRAEAMRVGALLGYPVIQVFGCSVEATREGWLRVLQYRQARVHALLTYLKEHHSMYFK